MNKGEKRLIRQGIPVWEKVLHTTLSRDDDLILHTERRALRVRLMCAAGTPQVRLGLLPFERRASRPTRADPRWQSGERLDLPEPAPNGSGARLGVGRTGAIRVRNARGSQPVYRTSPSSCRSPGATGNSKARFVRTHPRKPRSTSFMRSARAVAYATRWVFRCDSILNTARGLLKAICSTAC